MSKLELLACPCCGAPARTSGEWQDADGNWAVECSHCNLLSWSPEDWNRRVAPVASDVQLPRIPEAALAWIGGDDTGLSSEAIWVHMAGGSVWPGGRPHYPEDPADLGRCLRLLDAVPDWKPRIGEMAAHGPEWAALVARWDELAASYAEEAPTGLARRTYAAMRATIAGARP